MPTCHGGTPPADSRPGGRRSPGAAGGEESEQVGEAFHSTCFSHFSQSAYFSIFAILLLFHEGPKGDVGSDSSSHTWTGMRRPLRLSPLQPEGMESEATDTPPVAPTFLCCAIFMSKAVEATLSTYF